jgi:metallophosphoesterase (TIGR00282 family)
MSKPLLKFNNLVLRPYNYPPGNVGRGYITTKHPTLDIEIAVLQLQGRTFMPPIDCPFRAADYALKNIDDKVKIIIVDFHAEATSEKVTMGIYLDGKVSAVLGTHTHIQTSDAQILKKGTAYITDVGMSGAYDSAVGLRKDVSINRHLSQVAHKYQSATEQNKICGVVVGIDEVTGKSKNILYFTHPKFQRSV